jgi:hypothetical protein
MKVGNLLKQISPIKIKESNYENREYAGVEVP